MSRTATATGTSTYRLELIAEADGYKDYDEVSVSIVNGNIQSIAPNPATSGTVVISYKVAGVTTANIKVVEVSTSTVIQNSSVSLGSGTLNINVSGYNNGSYSIILEGDSNVIDTELFIKQ